MNVGPTKEGTIAPIFQQRFKELGEWLSINGEAIYGTKPWSFQSDTASGVWYTSKNEAVYVTVLWWPSSNILSVTNAADLLKTSEMKVTMLGSNGESLKVIYCRYFEFLLIYLEVAVCILRESCSCLLMFLFQFQYIVANNQAHIVFPDKAIVKSNFAYVLKITK